MISTNGTFNIFSCTFTNGKLINFTLCPPTFRHANSSSISHPLHLLLHPFALPRHLIHNSKQISESSSAFLLLSTILSRLRRHIFFLHFISSSPHKFHSVALSNHLTSSLKFSSRVHRTVSMSFFFIQTLSIASYIVTPFSFTSSPLHHTDSILFLFLITFTSNWVKTLTSSFTFSSPSSYCLHVILLYTFSVIKPSSLTLSSSIRHATSIHYSF